MSDTETTPDTTTTTDEASKRQRLRWRKTADSSGQFPLTLGGKMVATCPAGATDEEKLAIEDEVRKDLGLPARQTKKASKKQPPPHAPEEG